MANFNDLNGIKVSWQQATVITVGFLIAVPCIPAYYGFVEGKWMLFWIGMAILTGMIGLCVLAIQSTLKKATLAGRRTAGAMKNILISVGILVAAMGSFLVVAMLTQDQAGFYMIPVGLLIAALVRLVTAMAV